MTDNRQDTKLLRGKSRLHPTDVTENFPVVTLSIILHDRDAVKHIQDFLQQKKLWTLFASAVN